MKRQMKHTTGDRLKPRTMWKINDKAQGHFNWNKNNKQMTKR